MNARVLAPGSSGEAEATAVVAGVKQRASEPVPLVVGEQAGGVSPPPRPPAVIFGTCLLDASLGSCWWQTGRQALGGVPTGLAL